MGLFALYMGGVFINSVFSYAILPLNLFTDEKYSTLSSNEKILYALLLNRVNFSKKNLHKFSDCNGVFVYYTNEQIQKNLNCSKNTAKKALNNLESANLIKKKYQKQGKPIKIYVNDIRPQEKSVSFSPKKPYKIEKPVSFDTQKMESRVQFNRANFGDMKNKKRRS